MNNLKDTIINLFYIEHTNTKDIADICNTSLAYITKIVKTDNRYIEEKNYRKQLAKEKRKVYKNKFIKSKREQQRIDDTYSIVQTQHIQATNELSGTKHLSNENYRKWNYSAYKYNPSKKGMNLEMKN